MIFDTFDAREDAIATLASIEPVTFIDTSISIDHAPASIGLVILPVPFKGALVVPHYGATAQSLSRAFADLSVVFLPLFQRDLAEDQLFFWLDSLLTTCRFFVINIRILL